MPFAAAAAAAAIGGGIYSGLQASNAAGAQKAQLQKYQQGAQQQMGINTQNFAPYTEMGKNASNLYNQDLGALTTPFNPTVQQLEQTPGYQFELQQGTNSTNNAMAAQGLSGSGAELGALDQYSTGLANNTYKSLADIYNQNRSTTADILGQGVNAGETAAANLGSTNSGLLSQQGAALAGIGQSQAGADVGMAQAASGALNGLTQAGYSYPVMQAFRGYNNGGSSGANSYVSSPNALQSLMGTGAGGYVP